MSEKKQDQMIRETIDQYRAGIESMPSLRAQIIHKMTEKPARDNRVYYRLAAVAAALVLLLGVVVPTLSGNSSLNVHPDQIRNGGEQIASMPAPTEFVAMARPEGSEPAPEAEPDYRTRIDTVDPDLVHALVPVNLSYEKSGIRLNVLQGAVKENEALFVYSVEDLRGGRLNGNTSNPVFPAIGGFDGYDTVLAEYDEAGNRCTFGIHVRYQDLPLSLDSPAFPLTMQFLEVIEAKSGVFTANRESSESPALVEIPELMDYYIKNRNGGQNEYFKADDYRNQGLKVIDYSSPEDIPLGEHVRISHAGIYDGQLHVQLHFLDNSPVQITDNTDVSLLMDADVSLPDGTDLHSAAGMAGSMRWDTDGDGIADFEELIFTLNSVPAGAQEFRVDLTETTQVLKDGWKVDVPLSVVWKGEAPYSEILHRIEKETIPDYVMENYPRFIDRLVPINLSSVDQGIRLDILYGSVFETEALFVYSIEDLEGSRITEASSGCPYIAHPDSEIRTSYKDLSYDASTCRYTGVVRYGYDRISDISRDGNIELVLHSMSGAPVSSTFHLEDLLRESVGEAGLSELPELLEYKVKSKINEQSGKYDYYTNEDYRNLGLKVLKNSQASKPLGEFVRLSAIGKAGGMIHLQLEYPDKSYEYSAGMVTVSCTGTGTRYTLPSWARPLAWDTNNDGIADFEEYIFPCGDSIPENLHLDVTVLEPTSSISGKWELRLPLDRFPFLEY